MPAVPLVSRDKAIPSVLMFISWQSYTKGVILCPEKFPKNLDLLVVLVFPRLVIGQSQAKCGSLSTSSEDSLTF